MRYSFAALLAFAASALAQTAGFDVMTAPTQGSAIPAGKTFTIEWEPTANKEGTVTLTLLGGATPSTLQILSAIKAGVPSTAGKFAWAVDSSLGEFATYGIKLSYDADPSIFQYSFPFTISKAAAAVSSSSSSSAAAATTSAKTSASTSSSSSAAPVLSSTSVAASSSAVTVYTTALTTTSCSSTSAVAVPTTFATVAPSTFPTVPANATYSSPANKTGPSATSTIVTVNGAGSLNVAGSLAAAAAFVALFAAL